MTRDDFSSTTLMATQFPYIRMIMKIRMVMPNPSMSWLMPAWRSCVGSVLSGSGQRTSTCGGREQRRAVGRGDPEPVEAVATANAVAAWRTRVGVRPPAFSSV